MPIYRDGSQPAGLPAFWCFTLHLLELQLGLGLAQTRLHPYVVLHGWEQPGLSLTRCPLSGSRRPAVRTRAADSLLSTGPAAAQYLTIFIQNVRSHS